MAVPPLGRNPNSSSAADCNISSGMAQVFGNPNVCIQEDCEVLSDTYTISLQHENLHNASENSLDKFISLVKEESQLLHLHAR
jgi:hypothetical protein